VDQLIEHDAPDPNREESKYRLHEMNLIPPWLWPVQTTFWQSQHVEHAEYLPDPQILLERLSTNLQINFSKILPLSIMISSDD